jgi:DNA-directed RNA polymerase subunit E'/Rpb7
MSLGSKQTMATDSALTFTKYKKSADISIYTPTLITRKIPISIIHVGKNIKQTLEKIIASQIEGKCVVEGFIKPGSAKIATYSSGIVKADEIIFDITFECMVCSPVEGMLINCVAKNITKMGIRAETNENPSPVVIFISRDHHYTSTYFSNIKENDDIQVSVIGQRFELNDKYVSIIAKVVEPKTVVTKQKPMQAKPGQAKSGQAKSGQAKSVVKRPVAKPKLMISNE